MIKSICHSSFFRRTRVKLGAIGEEQILTWQDNKHLSLALGAINQGFWVSAHTCTT